MFELVTAILLDPPDRARGRAHVPLAPWLADHFPGAPIVPGTLLLELAAQIAGPLAEHSVPDLTARSTAYSFRGAVLGMVRSAVFRAAVAAPADVEIEATVTRREEAAVVARVEVRCGGGVAATAELVFAMVEAAGAAWAEREARVARWQAAW